MLNQIGPEHINYHRTTNFLYGLTVATFLDTGFEYFNGISPKIPVVANGSLGIVVSNRTLSNLAKISLKASALTTFLNVCLGNSTKPLSSLLQKNVIKFSLLLLPAAIVKIAFFSIAHRLANKTNSKPRMDIKIEKRVERTIYIISVLTLSVFAMPLLYSKIKGKTYNINITRMVKYFAIQAVIQIAAAECFAYHGTLMRDSLKNNPKPWADYSLKHKGNLGYLGYGLEKALEEKQSAAN